MKRTLTSLVPLAALVSVLSLFSTAARSDVLSEETGQKILEELANIRSMLENSERPTTMPTQAQILTLKLGSEERRMGSSDASLVLVEFTDYQCPYCKLFHDTVFPLIKKDYIDSGRLQYTIVDMPLPMHPEAEIAATASHCAASQGSYWKMIDALFANQSDLRRDALVQYAEELEMDGRAFGECLDRNEFADEIAAGRDAAMRIGVNGTPSFVLGQRNGDSITGPLLVGSMPYASFAESIEEQLVLTSDDGASEASQGRPAESSD